MKSLLSRLIGPGGLLLRLSAEGRASAAELTRIAARHGLGELRRIHRSRKDFSCQPFVVLVTGGLFLGAALYFNDLEVLAFIAVLFAVAIGIGVVYLTDTNERNGRLWIGVCDGGVIALVGRAQPIVLPWASIAGVQRVGPSPAQPTHVLVGTSGGTPVAVGFSVITERSALMRSVAAGQAQPRPVRRYAIVAGAAVAAVAVAAWLIVVPEFFVQSEDDLPATTAELGRACEGAGIAFTGAAPFGGPAPHPIALFAQDERDNTEVYEQTGTEGTRDEPGWNHADVRAVQLVACVRRTGDGSYSQSCTYRRIGGSGGFASVGLYRGEFTVTVYELRTHNEVGTFAATGDLLSCPQSVDDEDDNIYGSVSLTTYRSLLGHLVDR